MGRPQLMRRFGYCKNIIRASVRFQNKNLSRPTSPMPFVGSIRGAVPFFFFWTSTIITRCSKCATSLWRTPLKHDSGKRGENTRTTMKRFRRSSANGRDSRFQKLKHNRVRRAESKINFKRSNFAPEIASADETAARFRDSYSKTARRSSCYVMTADGLLSITVAGRRSNV